MERGIKAALMALGLAALLFAMPQTRLWAEEASPPPTTEASETGEATLPPNAEETTAPATEAEGETEEEGAEQAAGILEWAAAHKPIVIGGCAALLALVVGGCALAARRRKGQPSPAQGAPMEAGGVRAANIQGIGGRSSQQDSFALTDVADTAKGLLAIVADGIGGGANGAEISRIAVNRAMADFRGVNDIDAPEPFLMRVFANAQREARDYIRQNGNAVGGTTAVAAFARDGALWFASSGDSRICLLRGGRLIQLNREHTRAAYLDEARNDPKRAAVTSFIGMEGELRIDRNTQAVPMLPGDRLLLMTDGVFGTLSDTELAAAAGLPNVYEAGAAVENAVVGKHKANQDNYTAVLLTF